MKLIFFKLCPVFVFYTDKLVPMGGISYVFGPLCFILIKPKYKDDVGLHDHQMVHIYQHWRSFWVHHFKYNESDKYRFESEVEAYAVQYGAYPDKKHFDLFVEFMLEKYKLAFCKKTIEDSLLREIKKIGLPRPN